MDSPLTGGAANGAKRALHENGAADAHKKRKQEKERRQKASEGSSEDVLLADVRALSAKQSLSSTQAARALPERFSELLVRVAELSSTGDGLAFDINASRQIYVVPFSVPGDTVRIKVIKHFEDAHYSLADFISVVQASPLRDDSRISCQYFASCSGCQFQMLDYDTQLAHKRSIVEKAYKNFSQLPPELIPAIQDTMGSPLQYGYRTKLTPHFDGPPGYRLKRNRRDGKQARFTEVPPIGFQKKGQRITLDIEDCPIGTDAVRMGMKRERKQVAEKIGMYKKGATILLRESTQKIPKGDSNGELRDLFEKNEEGTDLKLLEGIDYVKVETPEYTEIKTCITDNQAVSTEFIDSFTFTNPAGSFFQNNNSILPPFTQYIREHILPAGSSSSEINYLIDAYSGSGLFTITLASLFKSSMGIDISGPSIQYALKNAALNNLPPSHCNFTAADAPELFKSVTFPSDETVVCIDPPRKGCDESFMNQLLGFAPRRVVYVSCNVHTQARDVGVLVMGKGGVRYKIESLRGFDFFPQTGHVEGVAVLSRVDEAPTEGIVAQEDGNQGVQEARTDEAQVDEAQVDSAQVVTGAPESGLGKRKVETAQEHGKMQGSCDLDEPSIEVSGQLK